MRFRTHPMMFRRLMAALLVVLPLAFVAGCSMQDYPQSSLHPHSNYAQWIQTLLEQLTFWVVIIFVVVQALLIYAAIRFRSRPGAPDPKPIHGNTALEIGWTIAPALILTLVAVPTVLTIFKSQAPPPEDALQVRVVGHQWWWEFQYPDLGITTASELHVPVGVPVNISLETADVIHSFWFPAMGGKRDVIPGRTNRLWFTPSDIGQYPGQCAELCGTSHANMRMALMVQAPEEFQAWVAAQQLPPVEPEAGTLAAQGKQYFTQGQCIVCHMIQGVSAGVIGPNLTHVGSRTTIAGGIFPNDAADLGKWIINAPARKPGAKMLSLKDMAMSPEQVPAIVAYLQSLK